MAKKGMKRYKPGDGMDSEKHQEKNASDVEELQGKAKESKKKLHPNNIKAEKSFSALFIYKLVLFYSNA